MSRKAQAAVEFLILLGFMLLVFTLFFIIISERAGQSEERAAIGELASIGSAIREEVLIASSVHDGYNRTFFLPLTVQRGPYTVKLLPNGPTDTPSELVISDNQTEYLVFLPANLTPGSTISVGYNQIFRRSGNISVSNFSAAPAPECTSAADCNDGNSCTTDDCNLLSGSCTYSPIPDGASCGALTDCMSNTCQSGVCMAQNAADGTACNVLDTTCENGGGTESCSSGTCACVGACLPPSTSSMWLAGGTDINATSAGVLWTQRVDTQKSAACCDLTNSCVLNTSDVDSCVSYGFVAYAGSTIRAWACANMSASGTGLVGPSLFQCTPSNDGLTISNAVTGTGFCCGRYSNGVGFNLTWGFNQGFFGGANKQENITLNDGSSCYDGSDNNCNGRKDSFETTCWNVKLESSCGDNTINEMLIANVSAGMSTTTRYIHDWRKGTTSFTEVQLTFANESGTTFGNDYSGNGRVATFTGGTTWLPDGRIAGSGVAKFDGVNNRMTFPAAPTHTGNYTIELRVKITTLRNQSIITYSDGNPADGGYSQELRLGLVGTTWNFEQYVWTSAGAKYRRSTTAVAAGTWYHVVGTAANNGPLRIFVNGVEGTGGNPTVANLWTVPGTPYWQTGYPNSLSYSSFVGELDDVRVYNHNLSVAQISALYVNDTRLLAPSELTAGVWSVNVTPFNTTNVGQTIPATPVTLVTGTPSCTVSGTAGCNMYCGTNKCITETGITKAECWGNAQQGDLVRRTCGYYVCQSNPNPGTISCDSPAYPTCTKIEFYPGVP